MFNLTHLNNETVQLAAKAIRDLGKTGDLAKAIDLTTGLTGFNLEAPAKLLVPLLAPFRQSIGRRVWPGNGTNWKAITAVTPTGGLKAAEATKANAFAITKVDKSTTYQSYGRLGSVTWEGNLAGMNFEDVRAREETLLLLQLLREEEAAIIGGAQAAIGAGPTITDAPQTTGGLLADDEYFIVIIPLTMPGIIRANKIARPARGTNDYDFLAEPTPSLTAGDGIGLISSEVSPTVAAASGVGSIDLTWTPTATAAGYAVFIGLTTAAANLKLQGVVTQSAITITTISTGGPAASLYAADTTADSPLNGIQQQLVVSGSGAYVKRLNGPLLAASGRGLPDIDDMLDDIYDRTKEEPDRLLMGWPEHQAIDDALSSVVNDRIKLNIMVTPDQSGNALPRFTSIKSSRGKNVLLEENPNVPGGMIIGLKDSLQIPDASVPSPWQLHMAADLMRLDYALVAPKDEFEVRARGALAGYAPSFQGIIYDIHEA